MNVLDLFCGGGFSNGLEQAGLNVVYGIDIWDKAIETYNHNHKHLGICENLTNLSPELFEEKYNKGKYNIDIIVGGIPCQGFSLIGKRNITDTRNLLYKDYIKYVNFYKPKILLIENVVGILSMKNENNEKYIDLILDELSQNYNCIYSKLYACDYDVPQFRPRIIIMGIRKDLNITPSFPSSYNEKTTLKMKNVLINKEDCDKKLFLSEKAVSYVLKRVENNKINKKGFCSHFVNIEKPSYTITASYNQDILIKYNDKEIRKFDIKELQKIQSFPDFYIFKGSITQQTKQIGNAVAPTFAKHLGLHIKKILS